MAYPPPPQQQQPVVGGCDAVASAALTAPKCMHLNRTILNMPKPSCKTHRNCCAEHGREPCPDRILDDIGGAFGMGALGGGLWHTYRGLKNSPKGYKIAGTLEVGGLLSGLPGACLCSCFAAAIAVVTASAAVVHES